MTPHFLGGLALLIVGYMRVREEIPAPELQRNVTDFFKFGVLFFKFGTIFGSNFVFFGPHFWDRFI